jgi:hypothetical protein
VTSIAYLHPGPYPVYIGFTTSTDAFQRELKRLKVPGEHRAIAHERANGTTHFLTNRDTLTCIIVMQPPTPRISKEQYAALVAHEALHVVQEMRRELARGECFDHESEAYLVQHIVQHCLQIAWRTNRVRRTKPQP